MLLLPPAAVNACVRRTESACSARPVLAAVATAGFFGSAIGPQSPVSSQIPNNGQGRSGGSGVKRSMYHYFCFYLVPYVAFRKSFRAGTHLVLQLAVVSLRPQA